MPYCNADKLYMSCASFIRKKCDIRDRFDIKDDSYGP